MPARPALPWTSQPPTYTPFRKNIGIIVDGSFAVFGGKPFFSGLPVQVATGAESGVGLVGTTIKGLGSGVTIKSLTTPIWSGLAAMSWVIDGYYAGGAPGSRSIVRGVNGSFLPWQATGASKLLAAVWGTTSGIGIYTTTNAVPVGRVRAVVTWKSGGNARVWLSGVEQVMLLSGTTPTVGTVVAAASVSAVLGTEANGELMTGNAVALAVPFARAFTEGEAIARSLNPFDVFEPRQRQYRRSPAVAGGASNAPRYFHRTQAGMS